MPDLTTGPATVAQDPTGSAGARQRRLLTELRSMALAAASAAPKSGVGGVRVYVEHAPTAAVPVVFEPVLYVVLQGEKRLVLDDREIRYDQSQLVVATLGLPALAQVMRATPDEPYIAVEVQIDFAVLADLIAEVGVPGTPTREAIAVHDAPPAIFEPLARLLRLASDPVAARLFARDAVREMTYHALVGPHGDALRQIAMLHSPQARVAEAAAIMAAHLVDPVEIPELARRLGMSGTTLHRHFRTTTGSAPSTYYKRLRLHEARRLGVGQQLNVAQAAAAVGYASAAHFSRDYKQAFGHAPSGDFRGLSDLR